ALNFSSSDDVTDGGVVLIVGSSKQLRSLNFRHCRLLTDAVVAHVTSGLLSISELELSGNPLLRAPQFIDCTALQELNLSGSYNLTAPRFQNCVSLTSLILDCCVSLSEAAAAGIGLGCPRLRALNLSHCQNVTDAAVASIAQGCPSLTHLNVDFIRNLSDVCVSHLAQHCKHLTDLDMGDTCVTSPDFGKLQLLSGLDVSDCRSLRTPCFFGCRELRVLNCSRCAALEDDGVVNALEYCPNLVELRLEECPALSSVTFAAIASHRRLSSLCLACCQNLTHNDMKRIAEGCKLLTELDVSRCARLTDATVDPLSLFCKELRHLFMNKCSRLVAPHFSFRQLEHLSLACCVSMSAPR
ncbi:MAG: hypothetical protein Q8J97_11115, partial [Flavobacteriaceae bacterium]|nr:hypothetical protein [Flavobacteriaceae bacterium]